MRALKVYTSCSLCERIMKTHPDILMKHTIRNKPGIITYHHNLSTECAFKQAKNDTPAKDIALQLGLQKLNLQDDNGDVLNKISVEEMRPEILEHFLSHVHRFS